MSYHLDDTIAAVASPPGGAVRGILRISGPDAIKHATELFHANEPIDPSAITAATAIAGSIRLGDLTAPLPADIYVWPDRRSFTGEPVVEIHTVGSPPLLEMVLNSLISAGARLAERGEFTLRAFLNGRIDLTQSEAVLGVIDAAGPAQLDVALDQLAGGLARPLTDLRETLLNLLAHLEAGFDFADEDLPFITPDELAEELEAACHCVASLVGKMQSRHATADLIRVVLVGWPNSGKSSLYNALIGCTGAIVSPEPATTRDYLTAELGLDGAGCLLIDTAGVEPDVSGPDAEVRQSAQQATDGQSRSAEVELMCLDSTRPLNSWELARLALDLSSRIVVLTKTDLPSATDFAVPALLVSSLTGAGLDELRDRLRDAVLTARSSDTGVVAGTAVRCRESLNLTAESLDRALSITRTDAAEELVASEIRIALAELGKVVGAVYTDDLLDRIFSRFCIGK